MSARIIAVEYHLPSKELTNTELAEQFPEWTVEKIAAKTGVTTRRIADDGEYSSHLAVAAAAKLLRESNIEVDSLDYLIVCTQSPDYFLPTTAAIVHESLGMKKSAGAIDVNLGCSGYVYALGLAKGLIESSQISNALIVTSDTYSKFLNPNDKSVRTIFGDAAAATLVQDVPAEGGMYAFCYGTDGSGAGGLIVPNGGLRPGADISPASSLESRKIKTSNGYDLYMDGGAIFNFTLQTVPRTFNAILEKAGLSMSDIDLFVFHQANKFMLDHLRKKLGIDPERFISSMGETGNTVSSTIPIALSDSVSDGKLVPGMKVVILGFGVGLSWAGAIVEW